MLEDFEEELCALWPESQAALALFSSLSTQWRVGAAGAIGLDYKILFHELDRMNLSPKQHENLFEDVRVMEFEALKIFQESAKK